MNKSEFLELLEETHQKIVALNTTKGHDYAGDFDVLANFKEEAKALDLTPEQVWHVYAAKHWSAITTYCREGKVQSEGIEGRILDVALYSFLLLGLVVEKKAVAP